MATVFQSKFARPAQQQQESADKIKESSVWLNICYFDEELDSYVSLPLNVNLSNLPLLKEPSSDTDYAKRVKASNAFAKALLEKGKKLEPGEVKNIPEGMITLQLMKTNTPKMVEETETGKAILQSILSSDW